VIQPGPKLAEQARVGTVINQAELHITVRPGQADECDMPVRLDVTAGFLCAEKVAIPRRASVDVPDCQDHNLPDDVWHRATLTTGGRARKHGGRHKLVRSAGRAELEPIGNRKVGLN
jgi:hypothetical protein